MQFVLSWSFNYAIHGDSASFRELEKKYCKKQDTEMLKFNKQLYFLFKCAFIEKRKWTRTRNNEIASSNTKKTQRVGAINRFTIFGGKAQKNKQILRRVNLNPRLLTCKAIKTFIWAHNF